MSNNFVFGLHVVQSLLKHSPEKILEIFIQKNRTDKRICDLLDEAFSHGVPIQFVKKNYLNIKVKGVHQGIIAHVIESKMYRENNLEDLLNTLHEPPFLLILDGITDPHNLGACLRTANAAGVHAMIIHKDKAGTLNSTTRKVACGAAENIPFIQVTNLARTIDRLKERGIWIIGTALKSSRNIYQSNLRGPVALIMGAEGKGMRTLTSNKCDFSIFIPMDGIDNSLNVSVATGVCLFEAVRQRLSE